jgi:carbon storage regulator CsrA
MAKPGRTGPRNGGLAMLVLARKNQESVVVTEPGGCEPMLKVTVLQSKSGSVRLGFEAQTDVLIHRWEVWERILADGSPNS